MTNTGRPGVARSQRRMFTNDTDLYLTDAVYTYDSQLPTANVPDQLPRYHPVSTWLQSHDLGTVGDTLERDRRGRFVTR